MANNWNTPGVPHRGWTLDDVYDVRGDGESENETHYETCQMCGNYPIRYVHHLSHQDFEGQMLVGCDCAEKMTNDYVNPVRRESELKSRSGKRERLMLKDWKLTAKGSYTLKYEGRRLTVFKDKFSGMYKVVVDKMFGTKRYSTVHKAKHGAITGVFWLQDMGQW